jgi:hypothetical protein
MFNPLAISNLLHGIEHWTLKEKDKSIITAAEITFVQGNRKIDTVLTTEQIKIF